MLIAGCESERSGAKVVHPAAERHITPSTAQFSCRETVQNLNAGMDRPV